MQYSLSKAPLIKAAGLSVFALAVYAGSASTANAQFVLTPCNGCTESQRENLAQTLGIGKHLIADFADNTLDGYTVSRESNGGSGHYIYEFDPLEITDSQKDAFDDYYKLITVYHANSVIQAVPQNRPAGYPTGTDQGSAIDWATNPAYYNAINSYLAALQSAGAYAGWAHVQTIVALAALQTGYVVTNYSPVIEFIITTPQGAVVTFEWGQSGKAVLQSIVDQNGNNIPIRNYSGQTKIGGSYSTGRDPGYSGILKDYLGVLGATISAQCVNGALACVDGNGVSTCTWTRCF